MSQITLSLDDSTQALVDQAAAANGMSKSRWVAEIIRKYAAHEWSKECLDLAGRFADFPLQGQTSEIGKSGESGEDWKTALPADVPRLGF